LEIFFIHNLYMYRRVLTRRQNNSWHFSLFEQKKNAQA